jgi:hypothetical protein
MYTPQISEVDKIFITVFYLPSVVGIFPRNRDRGTYSQTGVQPILRIGLQWEHVRVAADKDSLFGRNQSWLKEKDAS